MERVTRCLYGEAPSERASEQHPARSRGLRSSLQKEGIAEIYVLTSQSIGADAIVGATCAQERLEPRLGPHTLMAPW
jgi:hypothetical protein